MYDEVGFGLACDIPQRRRGVDAGPLVSVVNHGSQTRQYGPRGRTDPAEDVDRVVASMAVEKPLQAWHDVGRVAFDRPQGGGRGRAHIHVRCVGEGAKHRRSRRGVGVEGRERRQGRGHGAPLLVADRGAGEVGDRVDGRRVAQFGEGADNGTRTHGGPLPRGVDAGEAAGQPRHQVVGGPAQMSGDLFGAPSVHVVVQGRQ
ncbi:hypothetical protein [Embleya sp. NPDC059237]|uniref:hypothetical protein n=1 Tax=Embleya sp. NPDC059237 TaxID=3346784 RepID=UPI0036AB2E6E